MKINVLKNYKLIYHFIFGNYKNYIIPLPSKLQNNEVYQQFQTGLRKPKS